VLLAVGTDAPTGVRFNSPHISHFTHVTQYKLLPRSNSHPVTPFLRHLRFFGFASFSFFPLSFHSFLFRSTLSAFDFLLPCYGKLVNTFLLFFLDSVHGLRCKR
jgi:hypothetical protein